jgi:hypothetical protein
MARGLPSADWLINYAYMIEVSIAGFLTSGMFLGFVYIDVVYQMIATVVVLKLLFQQEVDAYLARLGERESVIVSHEKVAFTT